MERCPTCAAELAGALVCRRCQTDLAAAAAVAAAAERLTDRALGALAHGRTGAARDLAARAALLHGTPQSLAARALAALLARDFAAALCHWRERRALAGGAASDLP